MNLKELIDKDGKCVIPDGITEIEDEEFRDCKELTSIEIPGSVTKIGNRAFSRCESLASIIVSPNNANYKSVDNCCLSKDGTKLIFGCKNSIIPYGVTTIGEAAFEGITGLPSVVVPNSVEWIEDEAFSGCAGLISIEIPDSVSSIGEGTFSGCTGLTSIELPNIRIIKRRTFEGCTGLISIEIPYVLTILDYAFSHCTGLTSIVFPVCMRQIEDCAFFSCTRLTSITFSDILIQVSPRAFFCCHSLESVCIHIVDIRDPEYARLKIKDWPHFDPSIVTLKVPAGCGYAYRHHKDFGGMAKDIQEVAYNTDATAYKKAVSDYYMTRFARIIFRSEYGFPIMESQPFDGFLSLKDEEEISIICTLYDAYNEVHNIFKQFGDAQFSWHYAELRVSSEWKSYREYFGRKSIFYISKSRAAQELENICILGEYCHKYSVTLYYNAIKDVAKNAPEGKLKNKEYTVMRYVYFHELMHQYFDRFDNKKDEMEIEEGLAEFGALYVLDSLVKKGEAYKEELEWALNFVESKRGILRCYSNGARLFRRYKAGQLELKNILEAYC